MKQNSRERVMRMTPAYYQQLLQQRQEANSLSYTLQWSTYTTAPLTDLWPPPRLTDRPTDLQIDDATEYHQN
jgi:hypothetical protein